MHLAALVLFWPELIKRRSSDIPDVGLLHYVVQFIEPVNNCKQVLPSYSNISWPLYIVNRVMVI